MFNYFWYIILADAFAMAIIYKNYYKTSIIGEAKEVFSDKPNNIKDSLQTELDDFITKDKKQT